MRATTELGSLNPSPFGIEHGRTAMCDWIGYTGGAGYLDAHCHEGRIIDDDTQHETGDTCPNCHGREKPRNVGPMALVRQRQCERLIEDITDGVDDSDQRESVVKQIRAMHRLIDTLESR
jgi:hypothetical protein